MKKYVYEGKNLEEAKTKALEELKEVEENLTIKVLEEKKSILKKSVTIEVFTKKDLIDYLKDSTVKILNLMNIQSNLEVKVRENSINLNIHISTQYSTLKIFSDNNSIIIGRDGRTLESLQNILRQILVNEAEESYKLNLDIENYKEKRVSILERTAKRIAREVAKTKVETKLDRMNSYERRIIHNALGNNKYVYTESMGEEPNRYVVIKPKEESN